MNETIESESGDCVPFLIGVVLLATLCVGATIALAQLTMVTFVSETPVVKWVDAAKAPDESKRLNKPIVYVFSRSGCSWCVKLKKQTLTDPAVIKFLNERTVPVLHDTPDELDKRYNVTVYPTTLVTKTPAVRSIEGYSKPDSYVALLQDAVQNVSK